MDNKIKYITNPLSDLLLDNSWPLEMLIKEKSFNGINEKLDDSIVLYFLFNCQLKLFNESNWVKLMGMPKTLSYMQELNSTFAIVLHHTDNIRLIDLVNETRDCLNNFIKAMETESFYIAFCEYRKLIESAIWFRKVIENVENLELDRVDRDDSYKGEIRKYFIELLEYYEASSDIMHNYKRKDIVYFNLNDVYRFDGSFDYLSYFMDMISKTAETLYENLTSIIDVFEPNQEIKNYKKLLKKVCEIREYKQLSDNFNEKRESFAFFRFDNSVQERIENILVKDRYTQEDINVLYKYYAEWISDRLLMMTKNLCDNMCSVNYINQNYDIGTLFNKTRLLKNVKNTSIRKVNFDNNYLLTTFLFDKKLLMPTIPNYDSYALLCYKACLIFLKEINIKFKCLELGILRSYVEDFLISYANRNLNVATLVFTIEQFCTTKLHVKINPPNDAERKVLSSGRHISVHGVSKHTSLTKFYEELDNKEILLLKRMNCILDEVIKVCYKREYEENKIYSESFPTWICFANEYDKVVGVIKELVDCYKKMLDISLNNIY